jgi:hypothetical protein
MYLGVYRTNLFFIQINNYSINLLCEYYFLSHRIIKLLLFFWANTLTGQLIKISAQNRRDRCKKGSEPNLKIMTHKVLVINLMYFYFLQLGDYFCFMS